MSDSLQPMESSLPGCSVYEDSPGKNTGVGCHAPLQGISPTQGSNPGLPHSRWILYQLSHEGSPASIYLVALHPGVMEQKFKEKESITYFFSSLVLNFPLPGLSPSCCCQKAERSLEWSSFHERCLQHIKIPAVSILSIRCPHLLHHQGYFFLMLSSMDSIETRESPSWPIHGSKAKTSGRTAPFCCCP